MNMPLPPDNSKPEDEALEAPSKLVAALKRLPVEHPFVPPTVDEAVLRAARQHLERTERRPRHWFRLLPWLASAAAVLILAFWGVYSGNRARNTPAPAFAREDINQDGRVDILDAFALARQLKTGARLDPRLDINGDGVVDERDVQTIASHAVHLEARLDKGGRS